MQAQQNYLPKPLPHAEALRHKSVTSSENKEAKKLSESRTTLRNNSNSGVASPTRLRGKMFNFRRITLFCLEKRLSKHKMTIFSKTVGGMAPFASPWLHL